MINKNRRSRRLWSFSILLLLTVALLMIPGALPAESVDRSHSESAGHARWRIVIDPGHGGHDTGVKVPEGAAEKQVALALAEAIPAQLGSGCQVILTRAGDYKLDNRERCSIANHQGGDLFISLHAGASRRRALNRWTVYHDTAVRPDGGKAGAAGGPPFQWSGVQQPHVKASAELAECLKNRLSARLGNQEVDTAAAPAAVLQGADMPAVLIEAGYLTHPATVRAMTEETGIRRAARAIAEGIGDFLGKN